MTPIPKGTTSGGRFSVLQKFGFLVYPNIQLQKYQRTKICAGRDWLDGSAQEEILGLKINSIFQTCNISISMYQFFNSGSCFYDPLCKSVTQYLSNSATVNFQAQIRNFFGFFSGVNILYKICICMRLCIGICLWLFSGGNILHKNYIFFSQNFLIFFFTNFFNFLT